ncbi:class II histone deacetylase complex subunits 2 and 3-domain-containing protein [Aspergillus pseudotamarii]|uniref:Class II histone deacetylase complex subunits 2 and 3-domain-containing protein n=1 Tax=Aspergillus pseudotamarii TaxID=132259 RepID=A0A5N6SNL9_ASPPS|nr:class II histone deacetylase complex subunits 2 and 3-domain-containing protein [Aspergillus pseudotamarii]KAE8135507.1 class II histone deacetylase complex subunits 2 and 3-domain-containing protein [Aspergillus pseudotamarii]
MWRKRKISSSISTHSSDKHRKKRHKNTYPVIPSDEENDNESSSLAEDEWYINCILDETESQYLIDWEGPWSPSWEPKEHANDAAIQVWEEKRRHRQSQAGSHLTEISETQSAIQFSQGHSVESIDSSEQRLEQRERSPLFIPFDSVSEPHPSLEANRWSEVLESKQVTPITAPSRRHSDYLTVPIASAAAPSETACVFEYSPSAAIPLEYLLPSEVQGYLATQTTHSPRGTPIIASEGGVLRSGNLLTPEAAQGSSQSKSIASPIIEELSGTPVCGLRGEVDGITEAPSVNLAPLESQKSFQHPLSRPGTQHIPLSESCRSGLSSLISQLLLPGNCLSKGPIRADRLRSTVPESNPSTSQVSINPSIQLLSQRPLSARQSNKVSRMSTGSMESHNQKKEVPSLAEAMEKYSQYEGATPREKMKNAYAQLSAKANSLQTIDVSVTPSSVEDIEPVAPVSVPETTAPLSVRVDKEPTVHHTEPEMNATSSEPLEEMPHQEQSTQTIQPSALTVTHTEEVPPGSVHLGPSEFAVPLPMDSRVKDDYERVLVNETQGIRDFLRECSASGMSNGQEERLVSRMREILGRLSNVATHPDLNIAEHIKDSDSDLRKEAAWAEYSSAKFLFLGYLVEIASNRDIHLVIMVQGEKTQKVVEQYLIGKGLIYTRPREEMGSGTNLEVSLLKGSLSLGIQSTHSEGITETYKSPSAIIALDSSLNAKSPSVEHMRTTFARHGNLLPIIRLIVSNSSEHIELCFPDPPELQRLQLIVQYTVRLRNIVGDLQDDALGVREDVEEILPWLSSDHFSISWPLTPIEPLHVVSSEKLLSVQLEAQPQTTVDSTPDSNSQAQKRPFVEDSSEHASKRLRLEMSQDNTQLTESTKFPSQTLDSGLHALEKNLVQMRTAHAAELGKFQNALTDIQSRLQEREKLLESLQHRYETRTRDLHKIRRERDRLAEYKATSEQRIEKQREDISKLKDERTQLRQDLEQARGEVKTGGGAVAELETAREDIRRLTQENSGLERKAEYEAKQAEYTREQYQTASNIAAQTGNEIRQLREENELLKRKVAGNASRLREINIENDGARHLSRISELEAILTSREDLLRRKEDELREIRKNRPSTRSTSTQPRSPRLTAGSRPTSPGINNHNGRGSALRFSSEMPS